jgi:hypothetical protein
MQFVSIAFAVCRLYVIFVAASGFLFGQLYFASLEWPATAAGIFGVLGGMLSGGFDGDSARRSLMVTTFCIASLIGVACDAHQYYAHQQIPGNSYTWILVGPFSVCLLLIIWKVWSGRVDDLPIKTPFSRTSNGTDKAHAAIQDDSLGPKRTAIFTGFLIIVIFNLWTAYRAGQLTW